MRFAFSVSGRHWFFNHNSGILMQWPARRGWFLTIITMMLVVLSKDVGVGAVVFPLDSKDLSNTTLEFRQGLW